jgi:peptidoglycan/LPS O-acetylase OafA/YrhL
LRLAAVAAVVLYHYGFWGPASNGAPQVALPHLAAFAQYGFLGVPVFFTISGFAEPRSGLPLPASAGFIRPSCSA